MDARPLSTRLSGVGRVISRVIEHFPKDSGFRFSLYSHAPCHSDFAYLLELPSVVWIQGRGATARLGGLWFNLTLPGIVRRSGHTLFWGSQQVVPPRLPPGLPVVLTYYDLVLYLFPDAMRPLARIQQRLVQRMSVDRAERILSISAQTQRDMIARFGFPEAQARVAHLGYDPPADQASLEPPAEPFILAVSTIEPRKNYPTLLEAYAAYVEAEEEPPYRLVIAGRRGWESDRFYQRLTDLQARTGSIDVIDSATDADLCELYRRCAFFCMPTLYEGFGLPLLEALANGAPALCSEVDCLREIAGSHARYLPTRDVRAWSHSMVEWVALHRAGELPRVDFPLGDWTWERTARVHFDAFAEVL